MPAIALAGLPEVSTSTILGTTALVPTPFEGVSGDEVAWHVIEDPARVYDHRAQTPTTSYANAAQETAAPLSEAPPAAYHAHLVARQLELGNATGTSDNATNVSVVAVGVGQARAALGASHWLRAATDFGSAAAEVGLLVAPQNSPAQVLATRPELLVVSAGQAGHLPGLWLEDDGAEELRVQVVVEPAGELAILPSAWESQGVENVSHTVQVSPDYGSLGQGDASVLSGRDLAAAALSFAGPAASVAAALSNLTYRAPSGFSGHALLRIQVKDGPFLAEGNLAVRVRPADAPLRVRSRGRGQRAAEAAAGRLQSLAAAGCAWHVQDGAASDSAEYLLSVLSVHPQASCSNFTADLCVGSGLDGGCLSARAPESSSPAYVGAGEGDLSRVLVMRVSGLALLNHHLRNSILWQPCPCANGELRCAIPVRVSVERASQTTGRRNESASAVCDISVVVPLSVTVDVRGSYLSTPEDQALELGSLLRIQGSSPGAGVVMTLSAREGTVSGVTSSSSLVLRGTSVTELAEVVRQQGAWYIPPLDFHGVDELEVTVEAMVAEYQAAAQETVANLSRISNATGEEISDDTHWYGIHTAQASLGTYAVINSSRGADLRLVLAQHFRLEVHVAPVGDAPALAFSHAAGSGAFEVTAGAEHALTLSIRHPDVGEEDSVRVRIFVPFGELAFGRLDAEMDGEWGEISEFSTSDEVDEEFEAALGLGGKERHGEWPSVVVHRPTARVYTIAGTVAALRRVLAPVAYVPPYSSPDSGALLAVLGRSPTSAEPEVSQPPGAFLAFQPAARVALPFSVAPLAQLPETACYMWGPGVIFISEGAASQTQDLSLGVDLRSSPSEKLLAELSATSFSFRVSVERGSLQILGEPANISTVMSTYGQAKVLHKRLSIADRLVRPGFTS
ncbi:unnamed protein product [Prorocentrum cordatum]|uniref:Beta-mannosidase n=1 Tax=Prorocentrum cordatum TaxID=2364126 RepID=A0ABN9WGV7_9DINO|nr:unnamed protein product [Polarella glacialis]